jgi:magnesium-transporting ATPase (P-type)
MILLIAAYFRLDLGIPDQIVIDIASVIFSIAPAGLFFMILLTYTAGSADLAKMGALVHRARSVEHLSQVNVICFSKAGVLTGTRVELEYLEQEQDDDYLAETRIRQILGDYARSISRSSPATDVITRSLEGSARAILEDAPFISAYGWSAVVFDDDDLSGVYVLADPKLLALTSDAVDAKEYSIENGEEKTSAWRRTLGRLGGIFNRSDDDVHESAGALESAEPAGAEILDAATARQMEAVSASIENDEPRSNIFRRTAGHLKHMFGRDEDSHQKTFKKGDKDAEEKIDDEKVELVFAYSPNIQPLYDEEWTAILPEGLIPLCVLRFSEKVHPDTVKTLEDFTQNGIAVKIFSAEPPEETAELLRNAGWHADEAGSQGMISGPELGTLPREDLPQAAVDNTFFGQLTALQIGDVVSALRENELYVALLGDSVNDVPAMQQADLKIAMHSSNQAVRSLADIILLQDSPGVLQRVLQKGQRIVNGLMDVLKLYVTQILYLTVLILAIQIVSYGFPYKSAQGGVIAVLTLTLPSLGLSLWASAGVLSGSRLGNILAQFVLPAGILITATAMIIYTYFLSTYGDVNYAQLAVTYTLVGAGLILVLFLKPPVKILVGGIYLSGDRRFIIVVTVALLVFALLVTIPLSQELLKLDWLRQPYDYLVILLALIWYALTLLIVFYVWGRFSRRFGHPPVRPV